MPRNDETLFACGTNALNPACRNYRVSDGFELDQRPLGVCVMISSVINILIVI